jgi:hypothetical protein
LSEEIARHFGGFGMESRPDDAQSAETASGRRHAADLFDPLCIGWRSLGGAADDRVGADVAGLLKNVTIAEAIVRTFSGGSPCGMCTKITTERQKEEKAPAIVKLEKKAEICPFTVRGILSEPAGRDYSYPDTGEIAPLGRAEAPPVPIPIFS